MRSLCMLAVVMIACAPAAGPSPAPSPARPAPTVDATAPPVPRPPATFAGSPERHLADPNCGRTALFDGEPNEALISATGSNPPRTVFAVAEPPHAAAFLFGHPLTAPTSPDRSNKILWVVGTARTGPLTVTARPVDATEPAVRFSLEPNAFPGDIYPSSIDVPSPGCWRFTLEWGSHTAVMDLLYRARP